VTQPSKAIGQTILLVEDGYTILKIVKLILEESGFVVLSSGAPHQALLGSALLARVNDVLHRDVCEQGTNHLDTPRQRHPRSSMAERKVVREEPWALVEGTYQGTRRVFLLSRRCIRWTDIEETSGVIRSHPSQWLQHATGPDQAKATGLSNERGALWSS